MDINLQAMAERWSLIVELLPAPYRCKPRVARLPASGEAHVGIKTMGSEIKIEKELRVGAETVVECHSPCSQYSVVFEDDGETGYFYALDTTLGQQPILDALHVYNVDTVSDRHIPSTLQIVWSADGLKSALVINRFPHAVFDFQAKRGYCRTNSPPRDEWSKEGHNWSDEALELFK